MILPEGIESMGNACNTAFSIMVCYNVISKSSFFLSDLFIILFVAGLGTD